MRGAVCLSPHEMKPRHTNIARWLATMVLMVVWFAASNHCALGLMQGARMAKQHAGCCSQKTPGQAPMQECCKAIHGLLPTVEKSVAQQAPRDFVPVWLALLDAMVSAPVAGAEVRETGPPREARSFAELVLSRSLRAHAPPLAA